MKFDIHYLFSAKYAKWIIISLISLFSLLIIFEYATLFFPFAHPPVLSNSDKSLLIKTRSDSSDYILNSSLFGVYVPNDLNEDNVKKSMLNVTLVGILLGDKTADSQVIIRSAGGEENTYKIGDKIPGGAIIKRIMAGGVLVERNGALESLSLPKNDLTFEPVAKPLQEE
ncbi:type II secretion system protein N [Legionella maioricensis]|uniref:General secretion pathway protein GspC n=1 Tax=Legionella maioricensis TaxID=2896528 RepID=A0A9X2D3K4_9GAMM|nr:type II secretion system protein N [Legionella maioricensis]MCL9685593.1 general secretion pathway protein GspC [Legionella maioricensis]MCL9689002.1 general secretion pathway protein GspC [Legionella maioricensis]